MAVRALASSIADNGRIIPIIEPVNENPATHKSINRFIEESMPFLLVCNPIHGKFSDDAGLCERFIERALTDYDNWTPSLYVDAQTRIQELEWFIDTYGDHKLLALIYYGLPRRKAVRLMIEGSYFQWHVFLDRRVEREYVESVNTSSCVLVSDRFKRRRNSDYPEKEFFTDLNTAAGNPKKSHFGDFSIVGDYYTETGGPAHAVALHHMHYEEGSRRLEVSHFISDRTETTVDTPGKTIEALDHLVDALGGLDPNGTQACQEYRDMMASGQTKGLGYMKRLAIRHHLEVMLGDGLEGKR